jgi:hypothetical protein
MSINPTKIEQLVASQFPVRIKNHRVDAIMENDLYRHYRCWDGYSSNDSFTIVTSPGILVYTGDMGTYVFERTENMIAFMGRACRDIDYSAEKCVAADRDGIMKFTEEAFHREIAYRKETLIEYAKDDQVELSDKVKEAFQVLDDTELEYGGHLDYATACTAIRDSELWDDCDFPELREYTFRFRFCLRAIDWFCNKLELGEVNRS